LFRKKISSIPASKGRETEPPPPVDVPPSHGDVKPPAGDGAPSREDVKVTTARGGLREKALKDFASGRYEDALHGFEKIVRDGRDEIVLRRMADCHYFLGAQGDKGHLSKAIDRYRDILRSYPGFNEENVQATYRLAESYRHLDLRYEALAEFKGVYFNYPESNYTSESLYRMAGILYEMRKFDEAIERFKEYIKRFPEGAHVKEAYFGVGDCYSQMRQFNDADVWYDNALKKWPALEDIPENSLLRLGTHYVQTGRYDDALKALFVYLNLFPGSDHAKESLYAVARSFERTGRLPFALKMFSLVIERYPGSREAEESALMMANMGVDTPGIPLPTQIFAGMDWYEKPIEAYDAIAGILSDPEMEEEVLFRKEVALIKGKRYREAFDAGRLLLETFPRGKRREEGKKTLVTAAGNLVDGHYAEKDYLSVVDLYFDLDRKVLIENGDFGMLYQIGRSLEEIGLLDQAAGFFEEMIPVFEKDAARGRRLSLEMAKIDYGRGKYEDAKKRLQPLIETQVGIDDGTVASAVKLMGDISYEEGLYREAAGLYSTVLGPGTDPDGGVTVRKRYADTLREMGMYASALVNYQRALEGCGTDVQRCSLPVVVNSYEGLGDCLYRKGQYRQAVEMYRQSLDGLPEGERNRWIVLNMGRGYAKLGEGSLAGEPPPPPEEGGGFWSRVMNYYRADEAWTKKYGPYIRGS
jgi:tetratricopeptide (TPR) repeat protein